MLCLFASNIILNIARILSFRRVTMQGVTYKTLHALMGEMAGLFTDEVFNIGRCGCTKFTQFSGVAAKVKTAHSLECIVRLATRHQQRVVVLSTLLSQSSDDCSRRSRMTSRKRPQAGKRYSCTMASPDQCCEIEPRFGTDGRCPGSL